MRIHPARRALARYAVLAAAVIVPTSGLFLTTAGPAAGATSATIYRNIDVVGGPVAAEGAAVVITTDAKDAMHLEGIAPNTGKVLWSHPYSMSAINPGESPSIAILDNIVVDLIPSGATTSPFVIVDGVNATTGTIIWHAHYASVLTDPPMPCGHKHAFCIVGFNSNTSTLMDVLNPSDGTVLTQDPNAYRSLDTDLYETDSNTPALEEISAYGNVLWSQTVQSLFGSGYDPSYGWDFTDLNGTEVGTIGPVADDHSLHLDNTETIGLSLTNGDKMWTLPGQFQCEGTLIFENTPFLCHFSGTLGKVPAAKNPFAQSYKGLHLTLQGFNTSTGAVTWTQPVANLADMVEGPTPFTDPSHLVIELASGKRVLLNTNTGKTTPTNSKTVYWCSSLQLFKVKESKQLNPQQMRVEGNLYQPCSANGSSSSKLPAVSPSTMGVTVDGVFLWSSPHGLATRVVGHGQGFA
ncbi:MAG TPA: hypothetical protein VGF87_09660 [Acidimicrobiales bacterium]